MTRYTSFVIAVLSFLSDTSWTQDLNGSLKQLSELAGRQYVKPAIIGFNTNLNTGWFRRAPAPKIFGFNMEAGVVLMGTTFKKNQERQFSASGQFSLDSTQAGQLTEFVFSSSQFNGLTNNQKKQIQQELIQQLRGIPLQVTISGPTFIGSRHDSVKVNYTGVDTLTYTNPVNSQQVPLANLNQLAQEVALPVTGIWSNYTVIPLISPQVTIGTILGTQFTIRYFKANIKNVGKFDYFGWGVQHNPAVFLPKMPFDFALSFCTQRLKQDNVDSKAYAYGLTASKQIGKGFLNITPYGAFLKEHSESTITYSYNLPQGSSVIPLAIRFKEKGENSYKLTMGFSVRLLLINLNADYNIAKFNSYSAGITFGM